MVYVTRYKKSYILARKEKEKESLSAHKNNTVCAPFLKAKQALTRKNLPPRPAPPRPPDIQKTPCKCNGHAKENPPTITRQSGRGEMLCTLDFDQLAKLLSAWLATVT